MKQSAAHDGFTLGTTVADIRAMLSTASADELGAIERSLAADTRKGVQAALKAARKRIAAESAERERVKGLFAFDQGQLGAKESGFVVGLDEVGRGAVAGPLAVGAVILPAEGYIENLNDSKQLTPEQRETVAAQVKETALAWAVVYVEPERIDRDGMSASLRNAFSSALGEVEASVCPSGNDGASPVKVVLLDGNPLGIDGREVNVVKGDSKSAAIAAASVVAKVERDHLMCELSSTFPQFGFSSNKGYASEQHVEAIRKFGLSPVHRATFCKSFLQETLF